MGLAFVPHTHAHYDSSVWLPPESEPFVPVTDAHRAAWDRVVEDCLPLNTRAALSARCMTSLGEYFPNEPLWSYNYVFVYDNRYGWQPLYHDECSQRRWYTPADFLDPNIPYWRDIFDDQIEQRQELFLRVVNDSACQELTGILPKKQGMHDDLAEQCAAREMYQYAAYLSACFDATQRLTLLQTIAAKPDSEGRALNLFELSFHKLDENVADEALRAAAKRYMEKSYLHASWVASHCHEHGLVLRPEVTTPAYTSPSGQSFDSYTTTDEKIPWRGLKGMQASELRTSTHEFIMKLAMKSGDDWAIRGGSLGRTIVGDLGEELMQRYPLLIHRTLGDSNVYGGGFGVDFTNEERARHRAKAYLLLVEAAGEEFARREYNPETFAKQIQYIEDGGLLKAPLTRAELQEKHRERLRQQHSDKELQEVEGD
ncbi:MAG: hypothetical protein F4166_08415 [Gammaproteobacteria bacterium]|nr:hypothetical protein [Gammaproteobacteria bacterium]